VKEQAFRPQPMGLCHQGHPTGPKGANYNSPAWQHLHGLRLQPPGLLLRAEFSHSRLKPFYPRHLLYEGEAGKVKASDQESPVTSLVLGQTFEIFPAGAPPQTFKGRLKVQAYGLRFGSLAPTEHQSMTVRLRLYSFASFSFNPV
jgi:hypothetical protein